MTPSRRGDWIQTFSGVEFYPLDPRPEEIQIEDIAHALSMLCRYGGHCDRFYSVGEHSVWVASILPDELKLWGLLHDASEAYLVDLPRPIKRHSEIGTLYMEAEEQLMRVIADRFGLSWPEPPEVGRADKAMLCVEAREMLPGCTWWPKWRQYLTGNEPSTLALTASPAIAKQMFLSAFKGLHKRSL